MSSYPYNVPQNAGYPAPAAQPEDTVGSWMGTLLITGLPLIGFVYILILAFGSSGSVSRRNWARAIPMWQVVVIVTFVVVIVVMIALGIPVIEQFRMFTINPSYH